MSNKEQDEFDEMEAFLQSEEPSISTSQDVDDELDEMESFLQEEELKKDPATPIVSKEAVVAQEEEVMPEAEISGETVLNQIPSFPSEYPSQDTGLASQLRDDSVPIEAGLSAGYDLDPKLLQDIKDIDANLPQGEQSLKSIEEVLYEQQKTLQNPSLSEEQKKQEVENLNKSIPSFIEQAKKEQESEDELERKRIQGNQG